jgi:transposase/transposase InsO family protein
MIKEGMQTKREQIQTRMMLLPPLEAFIPEDHPIRRLNRVLDLSFVHEAVRGHYCQDNGRPSIDPEVIIRLFLLQAIEGMVHVRELIRQVQVNLAYRWFIGYDLDEKLPDHSTLSKALDRFGDSVFDELFKRSIAQCKSSGLIDGRVLHVDATTIRADLDKDRVGKDDSPDPDARFGHFPDGHLRPGYKQQTVVDDHKRVILGLSVSPANHTEGDDAVDAVDQAIEQAGINPVAVCADSAYASGENSAAFEVRGIRFISPPRLPRNGTGSRYYTIEDFAYDESNDVFICPNGCLLRNVGRMAGHPDRRKYRASTLSCKNCNLKPLCTKAAQRCVNVGIHHASLVRLRADSKTDSFRQLYRSRAPVVEGVFAEAKQWHSLGRAWRRGLSKMRIQCLLIASVINLKRLISLFMAYFTLKSIPKSVLKAAGRIISRDSRLILGIDKYPLAAYL